MVRFSLGAALLMSCASAPPSASHSSATLGAGAALSSSAQALDAAPREEICTATIDERVVRQLSGRAAQARHCYEELLQRNPKARGRMLISVRVRGAGELENALPRVDEVADPDHTACVLSQFKLALAATFPGNCADVNIPLRFELKQEPADPAASSDSVVAPGGTSPSSTSQPQ